LHFLIHPAETRKHLNEHDGLSNGRFSWQFDREFYTSNLSTQKSFSINTTHG
jgi:hypothetical protein